MEQECETSKTFTNLDLATNVCMFSKELLSFIQKDTIVQLSGPKWIHTTEGTASFPTLRLLME